MSHVHIKMLVITAVAHLLSCSLAVQMRKIETANSWEIAAAADSSIGYTAALTEEGYTQVADLSSNADMLVYVQRVFAMNDAVALDLGELGGFVQWYSGCEHPRQSLARLNEEMRDKSWVLYKPTRLGPHRIVYKAGVPVSEGISRDSREIKILVQETVIEVVEIGKVIEDRQRARIKGNGTEGWISLRHMVMGSEFAVPLLKPRSCHRFCQRHALSWSTKCEWSTNLCASCSNCDEANLEPIGLTVPKSPLNGAVFTSADGMKAKVVRETETFASDGSLAPLTEDGYQQIADLRSDPEMSIFVHRVLEAQNLIVTDEGALNGFIGWFSGTRATQSLKELNEQMGQQSWTSIKQANAVQFEHMKQGEAGGPGDYRITWSSGMPVNSGPSQLSKEVAHLKRGQVVSILEVGSVEDGRLRARIGGSHPGWISVRHTQEKIAFAVPVSATLGCLRYCDKHEMAWFSKCAWTSNECAGCDACGEDLTTYRLIEQERLEEYVLRMGATR